MEIYFDRSADFHQNATMLRLLLNSWSYYKWLPSRLNMKKIWMKDTDWMKEGCINSNNKFPIFIMCKF